MKQITERQKQFLDFITQYQKENSFPPTVREMSRHFEISLRAVQDHIIALQKKGFLEQKYKTTRSIRLIQKNMLNGVYVAKIPLVGTIVKGKPLLCKENLIGAINLAEPLIQPGKKYFAIKVYGPSMKNAGILDGDLAVIEQCEVANDGQIVVAIIDDAILLKRFYKESVQIRLQSENPDFQPIYTENAQIAGILSNIVRTY